MISKFRISPFLNSFSCQHFSKKKIYNYEEKYGECCCMEITAFRVKK